MIEMNVLFYMSFFGSNFRFFFFFLHIKIHFKPLSVMKKITPYFLFPVRHHQKMIINLHSNRSKKNNSPTNMSSKITVNLHQKIYFFCEPTSGLTIINHHYPLCYFVSFENTINLSIFRTSGLNGATPIFLFSGNQTKISFFHSCCNSSYRNTIDDVENSAA